MIKREPRKLCWADSESWFSFWHCLPPSFTMQCPHLVGLVLLGPDPLLHPPYFQWKRRAGKRGNVSGEVMAGGSRKNCMSVFDPGATR